jgi:hypothetical protein
VQLRCVVLVTTQCHGFNYSCFVLAAVTAGNPGAYVAAVEFSDTNETEIPPTKRSVVDTTVLRSAKKQGGGTDMYAGIATCQYLLEDEPMKSTGHTKVVVLLTDGAPDSHEEATTATDKAKAAGIVIITMGVKGADLPFMGSLSSGAGYNFSAENFDNDAANIGAEIAPRLCSGKSPMYDNKKSNIPCTGEAAALQHQHIELQGHATMVAVCTQHASLHYAQLLLN